MPNQLSGGEQQRVALARALVNNAGLIVADEPTGNVDPEMSFEIVDLLNHINANGTTVVMVTHEHELVRSFKHRVIVIDNGQVSSDTGPEDLSAREENRRSVSRKGRRNTYYHEGDHRARREKDFIQTYEPVSALKQSQNDAEQPEKPAESGVKKEQAADLKEHLESEAYSDPSDQASKQKKTVEKKTVPVESEREQEAAPSVGRPEPERKKDPVQRANELVNRLTTGTSSDLFARDEEDKIDYSIYLEHLSEIGGDRDEKH